jgi:hypothetical protein
MIAILTQREQQRILEGVIRWMEFVDRLQLISNPLDDDISGCCSSIVEYNGYLRVVSGG